MPRSSLALGVALACASLLVSTPAAAQTVTVNQGDRIRVGTNFCTVGLNDAHLGVSLTAAHCGNEGDTVSVYDAHGRLKAAEAGTFTPLAAYIPGTDTHTTANDTATITWNDTVTVGTNTFSGDDRPTTVTTGDKVCFYGAATRTAVCAPVVGNLDGTVFIDASTDIGDSGGAVWAPGRGFIGVLSGKLIDTATNAVISYATIGDHGRPLSFTEDVTPLWHNHDMTTYSTPKNIMPLETIIAIVFGVIAALGALGSLLFAAAS